MAAQTFTPGPWRWEFNAKHKSVQLVGGKPQFDLTVMDFTRWGIGGAAPRFIEPSEALNGLQLMHRVCDRKDWIAPFEGRNHHADWCANVTHPDASLIAAAPDLYEALQEIINTPWIGGKGGFVRARAALAKARGEQ